MVVVDVVVVLDNVEVCVPLVIVVYTVVVEG